MQIVVLAGQVLQFRCATALVVILTKLELQMILRYHHLIGVPVAQELQYEYHDVERLFPLY
jgi:hypothetical protein